MRPLRTVRLRDKHDQLFGQRNVGFLPRVGVINSSRDACEAGVARQGQRKGQLCKRGVWNRVPSLVRLTVTLSRYGTPIRTESALLPTSEIRAAGGAVVPAIVAAAGDNAMRRFLEFFAVTINNANTRDAYLHACRRFFAWCDARGSIHSRARKGLREADRQAAPRRDPHAVRLADRRPDFRRTQSGRRGTRAETRRQEGQDVGARTATKPRNCSTASMSRRSSACATAR